MKSSFSVALCSAALVVGCTEDPKYMSPPVALEVDPAMLDPDPDAAPPSVTFLLPYHVETDEELEQRTTLATDLGVAEVPIARREELKLSIEWSLRNLDADNDARVELMVNGANEYFRYDQSVFVIDPDDDPTPPSLIAPPPITVPAGGTITGVIREDQVREAALDLDLITRGERNPFEALLVIHEDLTEFETTAETVPEDAIAGFVEFAFSLSTNRHVVFEFAVRARDSEGRLHEELLAAPMGELIAFAPADYVPPPPAAP